MILEDDPSQEDVNPETEETVNEEPETSQDSDDETPETDDSEATEEQAEGEDPDAETSEEKQPPRKTNRVKKRIQQLSSQKNAALQRVQELEAHVKALRENSQPAGDESEMSDEDYIASIARKAASDTAALTYEQSAKTAEKHVQALEEQEFEARLGNFAEMEAEFRASVPDYDQVTSELDFIATNKDIADLILDSDQGAQVAYYLGKHREEAYQVAQMTPVQAARHIGRIEARISAPAAKTATTAPKPITKVTGKSSVAQKDPASMSMAEYEKWRGYK